MSAAPETPQHERTYSLRVIPPPDDGAFSREDALHFLSHDCQGYLEIVGHAHAIGDTPDAELLGDALAALADDVRTLIQAAAHVLGTGGDVTIEADRDWASRLDRPSALQNLTAVATSQQEIFDGEETLLEGPGFAVYARLGYYLRDRLAEEREAAR